MRSDDILKSIKNADKKYIEQSDFDNAKEYFEKRKFKNVLSVIASAAACVALAVFVGINVYNVNKITPATVDTEPETTAEEVTEYIEAPQTDSKGKISITTKTYNRSIAYIKSEKTAYIEEKSVNRVEYDTESDDISYVLSDAENLYKSEKTYLMNKTDAILKYNGDDIEWTYRIDEGANFYSSQSVSGGVVYMKNDGEAGFLDPDGNLLWKTYFDDNTPTTDIFEYNDKLYFVKYYVMEVVYSKENSDIEYSPANCIVDVVSKTDGKVINTISAAFDTYAAGAFDISCLGISDQGFIIKISSNKYSDVLTLFGFDGEAKHVISFENDSDNFIITDAAISDDVFYISGTLRDKKYKSGLGVRHYAYMYSKGYKDYLMFDQHPAEYDSEENYGACRSFLLIYSPEYERIRALYTSECSSGGAVYINNGSVFWETVKPETAEAGFNYLERNSVFNLTILKGYANVIEIDAGFDLKSISAGGIYAQLTYGYPLRLIK